MWHPANAARIENETLLDPGGSGGLNFAGPFNFQAGVYYEDFEIKHIGDFNYQAPIAAGFAGIDINSNSTFSNSEANARGRVIPDTQLRNDNTRSRSKLPCLPNSPTK